MNKCYYILLYLLTGVLATGMGQSADDYIKKGLEHFKSPCKKCAYKSFTKAIEIDSTSYLAYFYRSKVTKKKKSSEADLDRAKELCTTYITSNPMDSMAYRIRGFIFKQQGDKEECCNDWNHAVKLGELSVKKDYFLYCKEYLERYKVEQLRELKSVVSQKFSAGDNNGAIQALEKMIELQPARVDSLYCEIGDIKKLYQTEKDYMGAAEAFTKAIEFNPNNGVAYSKRAFCKGHFEDYKGAIEDYSKAIQIDSNITSVFFNRGAMKQRAGDLEGALEDYNSDINNSENPEDCVSTYLFRAGVYIKLNRKEDACADYDKVIALTKEGEWTVLNKGAVELFNKYCK